MRARVFLLLAVIGFLMTAGLVGIWVGEHGFDIVEMFEATVDNTIALAIFCDLTISGVVFFYWASSEGPRLGIDRWWLCIPATLVMGLCFGFPLFMYWRERALQGEAI